MKLALIWAQDENGGIGFEGKLPWSFKEDMRFFRETTTGHPVIMGRRTHDSIGIALPKRRNLVVTSGTNPAPGVEYVASLADALALLTAAGTETAFVIGGARLYEAALPIATDLYCTRVAGTYECDTFFKFDGQGFYLFHTRYGETPELTFEHWVRV